MSGRRKHIGGSSQTNNYPHCVWEISSKSGKRMTESILKNGPDGRNKPWIFVSYRTCILIPSLPFFSKVLFGIPQIPVTFPLSFHWNSNAMTAYSFCGTASPLSTKLTFSPYFCLRFPILSVNSCWSVNSPRCVSRALTFGWFRKSIGGSMTIVDRHELFCSTNPARFWW